MKLDGGFIWFIFFILKLKLKNTIKKVSIIILKTHILIQLFCWKILKKWLNINKYFIRIIKLTFYRFVQKTVKWQNNYSKLYEKCWNILKIIKVKINNCILIQISYWEENVVFA